MIFPRPLHGDRVLGPRQHRAVPIEHARTGASGPDIDRNDQVAHELMFPTEILFRQTGAIPACRQTGRRVAGARALADDARLRACEPPAKAKTRIPAALAAITPAGLSSITAQARGAAPIAALA